MVIKLYLRSKNPRSLRGAVWTLDVFCSKYIRPNIMTINNKKLKKVFISALKSPHVNKRAQEQFEAQTYQSKVLIDCNNFRKIVLYLKIFLQFYFPDVNLRIHFLLDPRSQVPSRKYHFLKITSAYLKILDFKGEKLSW